MAIVLVLATALLFTPSVAAESERDVRQIVYLSVDQDASLSASQLTQVIDQIREIWLCCRRRSDLWAIRRAVAAGYSHRLASYPMDGAGRENGGSAAPSHGSAGLPRDRRRRSCPCRVRP